MRKRGMVPVRMLFGYGVVTLLANGIASWLGLTIPRLILGSFSLSQSAINVLYFFTVVPLTFLFSWGILFLFLRRRFARQYEPGENPRLWLKKTVAMLFPGELLRYAACLLTVGYSGSTGRLASIPSDFFDTVYLNWSGRFYAVRQLGSIAASDYFAYTACYLVYLLLYLPGIFFLCKSLWKKGQEEYDDLIRPESKPKYRPNYF